MAAAQGTLNSGATQQKNWIPALICLALAILTVIIFWSLKDCGFINLDDNNYVYENASVQTGLNWNSTVQAFSSELAKVGHWHPLTWLALMLDYSIFGLNPSGFHMVNLLFHVMNTILLFLVLRRMTKALWPSAFVAALFAVHPLHVESVAWVTERKDVLSTFFMMLTLGAYSHYIEHREFKRYVLVLLFFALGLMSKPMLVTLPFVLLLLDFWPLNRFAEIKPVPAIQAEGLKPATSGKQKKKSKKKGTEKDFIIKETSAIKEPAKAAFKWSLIYPLLLEKVPLFVLSIFSSIAAYFAAQSASAVHSEDFSLVVRIGNAAVSYVAYIWKMILPVNLAVFYPHPGGIIFWQVLGAVILLTAITVAVIWRFKQFPYLATGWLWFLGTLVPVIGIVQAGSQAMADRYAYIPLVGLFIMVAWGVPDLMRKWDYRREILIAISALSILCLSVLAWVQVGYWKDSITLYDHTLKVTENNGFIYNSRGAAYNILGDYRQAIADYNQAIEIKPAYAEAYYNRGLAYKGLGNYNAAIEDCSRAIQIKPNYAKAYMNRGNAYSELGNYNQAIADYEMAIHFDPTYAEVYYNRGIAYNTLGNYTKAIKDYGRVIELKPGHADAYNNRGAAYYILGNYRQAIEDFSRAIELQQDFAGAYFNKSIAYVKLGIKDLAIQNLKMAAKLGDERAKNILKRNKISW